MLRTLIPAILIAWGSVPEAVLREDPARIHGTPHLSRAIAASGPALPDVSVCVWQVQAPVPWGPRANPPVGAEGGWCPRDWRVSEKRVHRPSRRGPVPADLLFHRRVGRLRGPGRRSTAVNG